MSSSAAPIMVTPGNIGSQSKSRFPRLQECAHFHYEVSTVDLPKNFRVVMCADSEHGLEQGSMLKPNVSNTSNAVGLCFFCKFF